ncbi:MAG: hypothetical protein ACRC48_16745 [Aeromonas veronii]
MTIPNVTLSGISVQVQAPQDLQGNGTTAASTRAALPLLSESVRPSAQWQQNSVTDNKQIEATLARLASESPAAHQTIDALLSTLTALFSRVEGNELKATTRMLASYAPDTPSYTIVGQLAAGGFAKIMDEVRHGGPRAGGEPLTLREKATAFLDITNSAYFRETLERVHGSPELKARLADLLDIGYLETKQFGPARGATKERPLPDQLALYTFANENPKDASDNVHLYEQSKRVDGEIRISNPAKAGGSLTKVHNDFREKPAHANDVWSSAADLLADQRLTGRELAFARSNPRNREDRGGEQFGAQGPVRSGQSLPLDQTIVQRGNGFAVWQVKEETGFAQDASLNHKPVVAGPSGTTDRFMTAARLLGKGVVDGLGLSQPKPGEAKEQAAARADREMKEMVRWMAVGYLVDDNHHSMVEVNLGAANHGLPAQWGVNLYTEPFSAPIQSERVAISSQEVLDVLESRSVTETHYERFHYDLAQSNATVAADGSLRAGAGRR